jgi:hypothetical protein
MCRRPYSAGVLHSVSDQIQNLQNCFTTPNKNDQKRLRDLTSFVHGSNPVPEFIDPRFRENKPKTLVFSHRKRAYWACFRENCVYNFGHRTVATSSLAVRSSALAVRSSALAVRLRQWQSEEKEAALCRIILTFCRPS